MYRLSEIADILGCPPPVAGQGVASSEQAALEERTISWLLTDSRSLSFPETTLFFALRTQRGDGHRYIPELYARGVRSFVVNALPADMPDDAHFLLVRDTLEALQQLAVHHRAAFRIPIIGITGSNGKTTLKEWLYQMLSPDHVVTRSPRSYNSQIGVPLSVWELTERSEMGIFEAAISQPGEMESLQRIIQPTIGILTCLGSAHQENFLSMRQKCMEKLQLFRDVDVLFYPDGDELVSQCVSEVCTRGQCIPFRVGEDAVETGRGICRAVCHYLGMADETVEQRLGSIEPVAMRLEVKAGRNGSTLINDAYNNDLRGLDTALDFMARRPERADKQRVLILSDIQQTGMPDDELYKQVAAMLRGRGVDKLMAVGPAITAHASLIGQLCPHLAIGCYPDTAALAAHLNATSCLAGGGEREALILVKGARSFHFEEIVDMLEQKVHETILEVNLSAVLDNLNHYRRFLRPDTKMICMVKADAYGAGAVEIARTLQEHRVDYMAVAVADEGAQLREAGITSGIIVMNPEMSALPTLFRYQLEPEVYSFRLLDALIREAEREGITHFPIHIKLDTGMHRMGFDPMHDMPELIRRLHSQQALIPRSVFSHFVGSDSEAFDDFSAQQYELFLKGSTALQSAFRHQILRHICNSAAIGRFPERQMEMVRLGLGLYGIDSCSGALLHNVSTLRTTILQIHDVAAGESVGYSRRTFLDRDSRIASIPIGYADGLDRLLGNRRGHCLVDGKRAPYVGNICMDVCMIDVTDIPCKEGDPVTIFGSDLSPTALADLIGTIPYEILTGVSPRVKRVYYRK